GIRTRVAAVRGRCPRPLDEGVVAGSRVYNAGDRLLPAPAGGAGVNFTATGVRESRSDAAGRPRPGQRHAAFDDGIAFAKPGAGTGGIADIVQPGHRTPIQPEGGLAIAAVGGIVEGYPEAEPVSDAAGAETQAQRGLWLALDRLADIGQELG